jgi:hypothetical protein
MSRTKSVLLPLVTQLKACSARETKFSSDLLNEHWEKLSEQPIKNNKPTLPIMAALVLDSEFSDLLTHQEFSQMLGLAKLAMERFEEKNKTTKVGRILFDVIKEIT